MKSKIGKESLFFGYCMFFLLSVYGQTPKSTQKNTAYLFTYFTGNSGNEEAIRFALSNDGYNFRALNNNQPVLSSEKISSTGGVRDPHILRGADGKTFYMVVTDMVSANGWDSNRAMVLLKSTDLINWTSTIVNIQKRFPGHDSLLRVWAPQTIYDPQEKKYMIYFSMKHGKDPDRIYYAYANKDFTDLQTTPRQLFFSPTNGACIDGDIVHKDGKYYLFFKTEGEGAGIKTAVSNKLTEGYLLRDKYVQQTKDPVEGSGVFRLNNSNEYILMYDVYTKGKYQFTKTRDLENFTVIDQDITMNFHPRHGTVMPVTTVEAERLVTKWGVANDVLLSANANAIKKQNVFLDMIAGKILLPVKAGTKLTSFNPGFIIFPGISIRPNTPQNFTKGPVNYSVTIKGQTPRKYRVDIKEYHNPVLEGYYADPDIIYAEKTGKFYIYPTSDGFNNWSGTYFKAFSSTDLVNWKDEDVILDLQKDVSWAKRNAWAPCIIEKKISGQYKYFYYFTAAQKIGVAIADHPTGPFVDSGKPLIDGFPEGITNGQQIDPDVFTDPKTGKSFLYWGNMYMAGAELNEDMVSLKPGTTKVFNVDKTFREGTHVLYRNGIYYFLWSEDDTRSENYQVRYGTSDSPLGQLTIPANNLVISKDTATGIYATGHNSTIQIPGKDEWYIVYHRFNYPKGITMGSAAGYNREVCIDSLKFSSDGRIEPVRPTHVGIKTVKVKNSDNFSFNDSLPFNPIIRDKFTADPAALVHNDTVYLYTGHDEAPKAEARYVMNEWLCYSSTDMLYWKEHPSPLNVKAFSWAKADAWASQVIHRNGKFYWYVAVEHSTIGGKAIGVAVSDKPTGPFKDILGKAIVTNDMTKATSIWWDDIDPTVIIDDDGQAYLFWGNTKCYYAKLKENMIELDGEIRIIELPKFTEAPWIHKRKDWYYLSYAYQFPEKIAYAMSKSVHGPWQYKGILNEVAGNSNTNHQAIIEFKGNWYFIYHNGALADHGGFHRSVCIDRLYYKEDGTMKRVIMTSEGLSVKIVGEQ